MEAVKNSKEKEVNISELVRQDQEKRINGFAKEVEPLLKKYNVTMIPRVVITGSKVEATIVVEANG